MGVGDLDGLLDGFLAGRCWVPYMNLVSRILDVEFCAIGGFEPIWHIEGTT